MNAQPQNEGYGPGSEVFIRILWKAYTTAAPGLVACRTPNADVKRGWLPWQLCHAPSGAVAGWFDGPEQAQFVAAKLTDIEWLTLDPEDREVLKATEARVRDAIDSFGGELANHRDFEVPRWSPQAHSAQGGASE